MARHPSAHAPTAADVLAPVRDAIPGANDPALGAVLDDPDADAPRLAYADGAERSDPARAAFIRLQVSGDTGDAALLAEHGQRWAATFAPWGARDPVYRRGFVEELSLTGRSFISSGAGLFERTPLRAVRLIAVNFLIAELIACRHLAKLRSLDLTGNQLGPAGAELLLNCPHLDHLQELRLGGNGLTSELRDRFRSRFGNGVRIDY